MITREEVLNIIRIKGPSQPIEIKKALGKGDSFIIGAILTELREAGKILVSNTKRGGSPFYYLPEQKNQLKNLIQYLGEKDRRTAILLQEKKVLRDKKQDPLVRVALRQIKDYAKPLEVKTKEGTEIFWYWYELTKEEAIEKIKEILGIKKKEEQKEKEEAKEEQQKEKEEKTVVGIRNKEEQKERKDEEKTREEQQETITPEQTSDKFLKKIINYLNKKNITIKTYKVIRKNSDIELEILIPTPVGVVEFFCKAKNKKNNNDGDLSTAYLKGTTKKLPVLYITTGKITKKAKQKTGNEFKGMKLIEELK